MLIDAGERDRYVTVQTLSQSTGSSGRPVETWTDLAKVWMRKDTGSGRERFIASQTAAASDAKWTAPYRADMDPELVDVAKSRRLVYLGRIYDIVAVDGQAGDDIVISTIARGHVS